VRTVVTKPKACFVHVPKAGGSAVVQALSAAVGPNEFYYAPSGSVQRVPLRMLLDRFSVVAGHFTLAQLSDSDLERAFTFAFLREPVDRAVSLFYFYREQPDGAHVDPRVAATKTSTFADFVYRIDENRVSPWSNWQTFVFSGATDCEAPARELLPRALRNLDRLSFVGVQNELWPGVEHVARLRGWNVARPSTPVNATRHRPAWHQLEPDVLDRLRQLNECDTVLFAKAQERWALARIDEATTPQKEIEIVHVQVSASDQTITVRACSRIAADDVTVGIRLCDAVGIEIYGTNTRLLGIPVSVRKGETFEIRFAMQMVLAAGEYRVTAAVHSGEDHLQKCYHWMSDAAAFTWTPPTSTRFCGLIDLRATAQVRRSI